MDFIVYCIDRDDGGKARQATRADHLSFIVDKQHVFRYGGPLLAADGSPKGSLMILDMPDRAALDEHMRRDPYFRDEVFASVTVWATRQVVPDVTPGALAAELDKQRRLDAQR